MFLDFILFTIVAIPDALSFFSPHLFSFSLNSAKDPDRLIRRAALKCKEELGWADEDQTYQEHLHHIDRTLQQLGTKENVIARYDWLCFVCWLMGRTPGGPGPCY